MGNINGKFSDQNDIVTTGLVLTSNNNQTAVNATIAETDQLRGSSVIFQPTGLLANPTNDLPNVTTAAQGDVGAALAGIGQGGTPSTQPGGGGNPCFIGTTRILRPRGEICISAINPGDMVMAFNSIGVLVHQKVTDMAIHLVDKYTSVEFADGRSTGVTDNHKYWQGGEDFGTIRDVDSVFHWGGDFPWQKVDVIKRQVIEGPVLVYNITVDCFHTYIANGDAVSNLKPIPELE